MYMSGRNYAIAMLIIYPVGLPILYFSLLLWSRVEIEKRAAEAAKSKQQEKEVKEEESFELEIKKIKQKIFKPVDTIVDGISFLYESYTPKYWYWEVVECTQRLLLTAIISLIMPGTSTQIVISSSLALTCVTLYSHCQPFASKSDNVLNEMGQWQTFITFLSALIIAQQSPVVHRPRYNTRPGESDAACCEFRLQFFRIPGIHRDDEAKAKGKRGEGGRGEKEKDEGKFQR